MKTLTIWRSIMILQILALSFYSWTHNAFWVGFFALMCIWYCFILPDQQADSNQEDSDTE